jgi:putative transposase
MSNSSFFRVSCFSMRVCTWAEWSGKGAWRDNVFVERLWRSVKYERVYLMAYDSVATARKNIAQYFDWYNTERPHSSLDRVTPDTVYKELLPKLAEAA